MDEEYYKWSEEAREREEITQDQFFSALYLWEEGAPDPQIYYTSDDPEHGFFGQLFVQGFIQKIDYYLTYFPYSAGDKKYNYFIHAHYDSERPVDSPPTKYYIDKWAYDNILVKKGMIE